MSTPTSPRGPQPPQGSQAAPPPRDMFGNRRTIGGLGVPTQRAKNFKGTLVRLLGYLRPHRKSLAIEIVAGAIGTVFSVLGPKILGLATTKVFEGFVAKARGVPGAAIDFDYIGRILLGLIGLYIIGNAFQYLMQYLMAGIAQKTVYAMRQQVEAKFDRLPLKFFDFTAVTCAVASGLPVASMPSSTVTSLLSWLATTRSTWPLPRSAATTDCGLTPTG